tara:strand:- start:12134 stop:13852 length:1719 start_codon:yes stop_codon:yes gene_type:complete
MNSKLTVLYIIIDAKDVKKLPSNIFTCFSLSPYLKVKDHLKVIYPNPLNSSREAEKQLLNTEEIFNFIFNKLSINLGGKSQEQFRELLKPYLDLKISIYLYLKNCIPNNKIYKVFIGGKWKIFKSKSKLIIGIENLYLNQKSNVYNFLGKYTKYNYNFIKNILAHIQILVFKKLLENRSTYILSCENSYFMPTIYKEVNKNNKNILAYSQSHNIAKQIIIIIKQISTIILNKKIISIEFFLIPFIQVKNHNSFFKIVNNINNLIDNEYFFHLINDIKKYMLVTQGYTNYSNQLFRDLKNKNITAIFHTNRFPDLHSLSMVLYKIGCEQHLITHGTHTINNESKTGQIISDSLAIGMLTSSIPNIKIYSQSKFSDDFLSHKNLYFRKIKPVNNLNIISRKNSKVFNILSAGTVKQLGARRHYFESSFEYIFCITDLCKKLKKLNFKVQLTIRIRGVKNEIDDNIIKNIESQFKGLVKISNKKSLEEDIVNSDCLIALSSTTLEQAINFNIPSMSYGLSKYNHFSFYQDKKYKINKDLKNYSKLKIIEKILGRDFVFFNRNDLKREKEIFDFIL